jgi:hypothetical protein
MKKGGCCMLKRLEIDEVYYNSTTSVGDNTRIDIFNRSDTIVDEEAFYNHLKNLDGIENIIDLNIHWNSRLENVNIIKAIPNLRYISIWSPNVKSYEGIEWFKNADLLAITNGKKIKRSIEKITCAPIKRLVLDYGEKADFDVISRCQFLRNVELIKSQSPEFIAWQNVPLEFLRFDLGKFTELSDFNHIKSLYYIMVMGCRKFERFTGDNSNIRSLIIEGCKRFDNRSIVTLTKVDWVAIVDCASEITVSELPDHPTIKWLKIWARKLHFDEYDFKKKFPSLIKLSIKKIKKADEGLLKQANPDIELIC